MAFVITWKYLTCSANKSQLFSYKYILLYAWWKTPDKLNIKINYSRAEMLSDRKCFRTMK